MNAYQINVKIFLEVKWRDSQDASISGLQHSKTSFFAQFMTWIYDENRYVPKNEKLTIYLTKNMNFVKELTMFVLRGSWYANMAWPTTSTATTVPVNVLRDETKNLKK